MQENGWMENFKRNAAIAFERLPMENSQLFTKYSDYPGTLLAEPSNEVELEIPEEFFVQQTPIFVQSGKNVLIKTGAELEKKGVIFTDIYTAAEKHRDKISGFFKENWKNKFEAFNDAFFSSGMFIYVPENVEITNPFRKINFGGEAPHKDIIMGCQGSKFSVIEESYSVKGNKTKQIMAGSTEIESMDGSEIIFCSLQNTGEETTNIGIRQCYCGKDSKVSWNIASLGGKLTISKTGSFMQGRGSMVEDNEIILGDENQKFDTISNLHHIAKSTNGIARIKAALKGSSGALIKGMIKIGKNAENAQSYLAEHSILLNKGAKADAIPGLEIENNEVKATHSASVSKISDEQLFYLMSRGLDEENSKKLVADGFIESVVQHMPLSQFRYLLRMAISSKWGGQKETMKMEYVETEESPNSDIFGGHYKYR